MGEADVGGAVAVALFAIAAVSDKYGVGEGGDGLHLQAEVESVDAGQADIEQDDVGGLLTRAGDRRFSPVSEGVGMAQGFNQPAGCLGGGKIVLDDKNMQAGLRNVVLFSWSGALCLYADFQHVFGRMGWR